MKPKPKVRRVVLGVGHPWFWKVSLKRGGYQTVRLYRDREVYNWKAKTLRIGNLSADDKIRLVAEILTPRKRKSNG